MLRIKLIELKRIKAMENSKKENGMKSNADKGKYLKSHK
jgi:hypothetical protein